MKTLTLQQGTPEWLAHRRGSHNASEASVMRGEFPTFSRREFIRLRAVGLDREFSDYVQKYVLDRGHAVEPALRALAESIIGEDLYPVTGVSDDGYLSASFDGVTLGEDVIFEGKQWSDAKADHILVEEIPPQDYWQIVQQFAVCETAQRCLYLVGDGSDDGTAKLWIQRSRVEHDIPRLRASWAQFDADVAAYVPEPEAAPAPSGRAPETLPALSIQVTGMVTASNLADFKANALAVLGSINRELVTDEDFADAEKTVKWCSGVEDRLKATKEQILGQTADIDAVFRTMDEVSAETRRIRLELDKLVTREKENRKAEIVTTGRRAFDDHVTALKAETKGVWILALAPDFAGAIKGKKSLSSMKDAVDTVLANAKIAANESASHVRAALALLAEETAEHKHLFHDWLSFIAKPLDDIRTLVRARIAEHQAAEEAKAEALREQIRKEEADKLAAQQAAEQKAREDAAYLAEQERLSQVAAAAAAEPQAPPEPAPAPTAAVYAPLTAAQATVDGRPAAAPKPRIRLGDIVEAIAPLSITADGLASLGFKPVESRGAAKLYAAEDFPAICAALHGALSAAPSRLARKAAA